MLVMKKPMLREAIGKRDFVYLAELKHISGLISQKEYRIVTNNYDSKGGCFIMFGIAKAPGER